MFIRVRLKEENNKPVLPCMRKYLSDMHDDRKGGTRYFRYNGPADGALTEYTGEWPPYVTQAPMQRPISEFIALIDDIGGLEGLLALSRDTTPEGYRASAFWYRLQATGIADFTKKKAREVIVDLKNLGHISMKNVGEIIYGY